MAPPSRRRHPARTLLTLAVITVAVFGAVLAGTKWSDATWTPKLALDLEGGTQLILSPVAPDESRVTNETISQAIEVIRQRVDSSGVAEAEITSQGGSNIVVALPGRPSEETLDLVRTSAQMEFRPVLVQDRVHGPEDGAGLHTMRARTDAQVHVRVRDAQVGEEDVGQHRVVVLPGVHDHVLHPTPTALIGHRRELDELRTGTDDTQDLHGHSLRLSRHGSVCPRVDADVRSQPGHGYSVYATDISRAQAA